MHATGCFTMCEKDDTTCTGGGHDSTSGMAASMSEDQFAQLLGAINTSQKEMRLLREEVRAVKEDAAEKIASVKKEKPVQFRKRSHEVQHSCNKDLEVRFCEADASLARACRILEEGAAKEAVARTQQAIEKGKRPLVHRQKLLISELPIVLGSGRGEDELVEDSGDERPSCREETGR